MAAYFSLQCLLLSVFSACVFGSHFRGAVIMVRPKIGGEQNEMEVFFHISWRLSYAPEGYCDQSVVDSGILIGSGDLVCQHGCSNTTTISSMAYRCTDFSFEEDWTFGEHQFSFVFEGGPDITIGFTDGDWLSPFDVECNISTTFSISRRNDTGRINSTPRAITSPVLRLQAGCDHIIKIPVYDPDNDTVRCRWAVGSECAGVCGGFPEAELDAESCSITYNANQEVGHRAVAIVIEDYLPGSTDPMSSVGLQFLVLLFSSPRSCSVDPEFIPPTPQDGSCIAIPTGTTFHTVLNAISGNNEDTITEIQTVSPAGIEKSDLFNDENADTFYVNITWMPTIDQENDVHLFCFTATNSAGLSSDQVCIELLPGHTAPSPLRETADPTVASITVHPSDTIWRIHFDRNVKRPSRTTYITFHIYDTDMVVHRIDTSSDSEITFENGTGIVLTPDITFEEGRKYYINFERGAVVGLEGCGPGNEAVTGRDFWSFTTIDVTPPRIRFLSNPRVSNVNISVTWESNEKVTWKCSLITGSLTQEQECPNGMWIGVDLQGGVYSLEVSGTDMANNTAIAVHAFAIDTTPPIITFTRVPAEFSNIETNVLFQFRCGEICTYQCQFREENDESVVASPCNLDQYQTLSLSHGKRYILSVTATDQVGNVGETASYSWRTDFEAPIVFGVMNTSALCTSDTSPVQTGQAEAVDNETFVVEVTFHDQRMPCSITRTWRAMDVAGNVERLTQYIVLQYQPTLGFIPDISIPCDSSTTPLLAPENTATVANPCGRPLRLTFEDTVSEYTCPGIFTRTWNITDNCNQETSQFEQRISLYDVCSVDACGRNASPPRGICVQGSCICNEPWFGENCDTLIHAVQIQPVEDRVLQEQEDYNERLTFNGTAPVIFTLISSPDGVVLSQERSDITWNRVQAGNYTIVVEIENQVSRKRVSWSLYVKPGYTAFLEPVTDNLFPGPTPLELTGHVEYFEGNRVQEALNGFVPVTIEIASRNGQRELRTFSRQDGTFSAAFFPASTEYGSYVAGARHPRALLSTEQTSWDFLGMSATPRSIQLRDSTVAEYTNTFHNVSIISNEGSRALHSITAVSLLGNIDDLSVTVSLDHSTLEPSETLNVNIIIEADRAIEAIFPITIQSIEGATLFLSVNVRITQILPDLIADPSSINTRVVRGMLRSLDFNVTNVGSIPARRVRAILPMSDHLSLVSFGNSMQQSEGDLTLDSGESARLSVLATIPPEQPLGDISGQIVISSMETFEIIRFNLLVSSNMLMNLTVAVEDEYSYFAEGLPLLSNAVVRLVNNIRGIQETLTTGESGTVTFLNIPEDRYELFVTGPSHVPLNQIIVTSAEEPLITVFIARRAVSYTFSVIPTTFDETYTITLEADFETHVPIPVVTITPSDLSLEPYELGLADTIQYNITNHGLIRCDDVNFELPTGHPFLEFSTDIEDIGSLDALTSIIVPVKVTRIDGREKRNAASCVGALFYAIGVAYSYVCGDLQFRSASAVLRGFSQFSDCGGGGGRRYQVVSPVYRIPGSRTNAVLPRIGETSYTPTQISCDSCLNSILGCLPFPIPHFSCFHFAFSLAMSVYTNGLSGAFNIFDVADHAGWISCQQSLQPSRLIRRAPGIGTLLCIPGVLRDCFGAQTSLGRRSVGSTARDTLQSYYAMHQFTLLGVEVLGDERWIRVVDDPTWLRDTFQPVLSDASDGGPLITSNEFNLVMSIPPPRNATHEMVQALLERFNNTFLGWNDGILEPENGANMVSYAAAQNFTNDVREFNERIVMSGYEPFLESYNDVIEQYNMIDNFDEEEGVCAVVRIRINQEIALTRDAFLATLEIENMEASDLREIRIDFLITNVTSAVDSTLLFSISNETLTGSLQSSEDGWILPSGQSGAAEWLIAPLSEAAPTQNQDYNVGGRFSYVVNGENISVPLLPTRITVAPDPSLIIHYFWERFVIGDNPFTDEREPSVPFALGVAIHNAGYGAAMNLRITSGQPEIIDNDKGLLVTFRIIGTRIGSESVTPSLSVDFGDIPAMTTKVARWLMISSLQGQFMNYSASFEYMNPLGDPRLSVLDELVIHDLIRNVRIYQEDEDDGVLDFLVNDRRDLFNIPDALYSSKTFTRYNVSTGSIESVHQDSGLLEVRAVSNYSGWVYFMFEDMQNTFTETKRSINFTKSLNDEIIELPPENAWITIETQRSPGDTDLPYFLHIFDYVEEAGEVTYTLNPCTSDCPTDEQPFETAIPPVPPINVQVETVGSTWISVSWEQVPTSAGISSQNVTVTGAATTTQVEVDGGQVNLNVTDLLSGTMYTIQVETVAEDGQTSFPSVAVTAMTLYSFSPSPPEVVIFNGSGDSWIVFSWFHTPSEIEIVEQTIFIRNGDMERNFTVDGDETSVNVTSLLTGTEYAFSIILVASDGQESQPSVPVTANTTGVPAPTNLAIEGLGTSWILLSWQPTAAAKSYIIFVDDGDREINLTVNGNEERLNITGLNNNTEYTLWIITVGNDGQTSSPSTTITVVTLLPAPPAPEDVQVISFGVSWIAISWSPPLTNTVSGYVVIVDGPEINRERNITLGITPSVNITDLDYGMYRLTVIAVGIDGQLSPPSVPLTTSTIIPAPPPPINVDSESVGATWIVISWDSGSVNMDITGYNVTAAGDSGDVSITVDGSETTANVTGLQPETEYTLAVVSVRDGKESLPSDPIMAKTLARPVPPAPATNLQVKSVGSSWIVITWQQDTEVIRHRVSISGGGETRVMVVPGVEMMLNVTGLKAGTTYVFSITSEDINGQRSPVIETLMATTSVSGDDKSEDSSGRSVHQMTELLYIYLLVQLPLVFQLFYM